MTSYLEEKIKVYLPDILSLLGKPTDKRTEDEVETMKDIIKELPGFRDIPPLHRIEMINHLRIVTIRTGTKFLTKSSPCTNYYLVLSGRLRKYARDKSDSDQFYSVGRYFGDLQMLKMDKWKQADVEALEDTVLLSISVANWKQIVNNNEVPSLTEMKIKFLLEAIPGLHKYGHASREKVASYFIEKEFFPGTVLIEMGDETNVGWIIKQGECVVSLPENPGIKRKLETKIPNAPRGFLSTTTTNYHLGSRVRKQWCGEDIIILNEKSPYRLTTKTKVVMYEIHRGDMHKLPKESLTMLQTNSKNKVRWREKRKGEIRATNANIISQLDNSEKDYGPTYLRISKNFPQASKNALTNLRKLQLSTVDFNAKALVSTAGPRTKNKLRSKDKSSSTNALHSKSSPYLHSETTKHVKTIISEARKPLSLAKNRSIQSKQSSRSDEIGPRTLSSRSYNGFPESHMTGRGSWMTASHGNFEMMFQTHGSFGSQKMMKTFDDTDVATSSAEVTRDTFASPRMGQTLRSTQGPDRASFEGEKSSSLLNLTARRRELKSASTLRSPFSTLTPSLKRYTSTRITMDPKILGAGRRSAHYSDRQSRALGKMFENNPTVMTLHGSRKIRTIQSASKRPGSPNHAAVWTHKYSTIET
mmetsp:Transcript_6050/g.6747  ORF Transcript_6050/g.6747 Transcript_6050/m.6747 type:complete len:644 (-) Transcript_6050:695-2626(-)